MLNELRIYNFTNLTTGRTRLLEKIVNSAKNTHKLANHEINPALDEYQVLARKEW